jgi:hypothetical protein
VIPGDTDFALSRLSRSRWLLEDLLGAQRVAAMDEGDLGGDVREIQRLFDRRIAPADDGDLLVTVEKAVAGGAGRDTASAEGPVPTADRDTCALAPVAMMSASQV